MQPKKFYIAGVQFRTEEEKESLKTMSEGDILELVLEPENDYDPNAVKIMSGHHHFGYVPRRYSSEISGMIEHGFDLTCTISTLNLSAKPWEMCLVEITEPEIEDEEPAF